MDIDVEETLGRELHDGGGRPPGPGPAGPGAAGGSRSPTLAGGGGRRSRRPGRRARPRAGHDARRPGAVARPAALTEPDPAVRQPSDRQPSDRHASDRCTDRPLRARPNGCTSTASRCRGPGGRSRRATPPGWRSAPTTPGGGAGVPSRNEIEGPLDVPPVISPERRVRRHDRRPEREGPAQRLRHESDGGGLRRSRHRPRRLAVRQHGLRPGGHRRRPGHRAGCGRRRAVAAADLGGHRRSDPDGTRTPGPVRYRGGAGRRRGGRRTSPRSPTPASSPASAPSRSTTTCRPAPVGSGW